MSRGPRDLRDLICVSRLTFRHSDDEAPISDDERVITDFDNLSLGSSGSCDSRQGSATQSKEKGQRSSPDSGCVTNEGSPSDTINGLNTENKTAELKLDLSLLAENEKKKARKKKKKKILATEPPRFPFPKPPPLPPLGRTLSTESQDSVEGLNTNNGNAMTSSVSFSGRKRRNVKNADKSIINDNKIQESSLTNKSKPGPVKQDQNLDDDIDEESTPVKTKSSRFRTNLVQTSRVERGDYDEMLCFMDATIVSSWLTRSNKSVSEISNYIHKEDNYVQFAHFWLSDFPDIQKREIFEMEIEIMREELGFAFAVGRDQAKISQRDISNLIGAIFREYPAKMLSAKGNFLFLDYLDILSSERTPKYKKMLSDVKCSTKNRQYAQWLLATRSFALVSMWCAIVNFYRNLLGRNGKTEGISVPKAPSAYRNLYEKRLFQSLRLGYTDVIHYFNVSELVNFRLLDAHHRTLIFTAVMHNQPKVLQYLVTRVKPAIDINHVSDTGNTALHAAANNGSAQLVTQLLKAANINLDCTNTQCENATPLHLAVLHGHKDVVELLLKAGADRTLKMGDLTPLDIATEFDHSDLLESLQS